MGIFFWKGWIGGCPTGLDIAATTRAFNALVTEFIVLYVLGTPSSSRQILRILIAIKPERLLEPFVERLSVG